MIHFENVSHSYRLNNMNDRTLRSLMSFNRNTKTSSFLAVDDINFHLPKGGALGVLGKNGAGKSTLLKLLTRIIRPTSGKIAVNGNMSSLLEVGAAFHHDLTAKENIWLSGAILGLRHRDVSVKLDDIINFSELNSFIDKPVRTFSSGMIMRLAFSIGIHLNSDILVIDEALAVGDNAFQAKCLERIKSFRINGGTLILVSHDPYHLQSSCDRGLVLNQGRCQFDGSINEALNFYNSI